MLRGIVTLIEVHNVPRSVAFYSEALGFEVHQSAGEGDYIGWAWLKCGTVDLMLNAMFEKDEQPVPVDPARVLAHRDTTLFMACPDLDAARAHLVISGVTTKGPVVTTYGMRQLSFSDPDGYGICLQWPAS
jgi:catechol 2,3-dioxygenase-like lactoylglutathione lyase family enzyme